MEIIFAGGAHYGAGGFRSIKKYFDKVYLINDNPEEILKEKRECDLIISDFDDVECDTVFLCGYPKLIKSEQLEKKTYINVHGALLPKYRGMHSTFYAIMNGEKKLGISFHLVNEFADAGDILAQYSFDFCGQTVAEINRTIDDLVEQHAGQVVSDYMLGHIQAVTQDETKATFGAKRNLEDCLIDFTWKNVLIERYFAALTEPYPLPLLKIKGKLFEVLDHEIVDRDYFGPTGRAVYIDNRGVWIKIEEGFLIISKVRSWETKEVSELKELVGIGHRF